MTAMNGFKKVRFIKNTLRTKGKVQALVAALFHIYIARYDEILDRMREVARAMGSILDESL